MTETSIEDKLKSLSLSDLRFLTSETERKLEEMKDSASTQQNLPSLTGENRAEKHRRLKAAISDEIESRYEELLNCAAE